MKYFEQAKLLLENVPLFNLISLIFAVGGVVLAFVFYYRGQRRRLPMYAVRNINLIEDSVEKVGEIEISYAGSKVKNLSVARVAFWNRGQETINSSDIAATDRIKVLSTEGVFLGFSFVSQKNMANNFSVIPLTDPLDPNKHKQNELEIKFEYVDQDEGIILQVFHTGKTGDGIKIDGMIKGAGKIKKLNSPLINKIRPFSDYFGNLKIQHKKIILGVLLFVTPFVALTLELLPRPTVEPTYIKYLGFTVIAIPYWLMSSSLLRRRLPKGFELFEGDSKSWL